VPIVLKSGSLNLLEPYGPVKACNGIALPLCFTLIIEFGSQAHPDFVFGVEVREEVVRVDPEAIYSLCLLLKTVIKIMSNHLKIFQSGYKEKIKLNNKKYIFIIFVTVLNIPVGLVA
jgi:hypothetical protein